MKVINVKRGWSKSKIVVLNFEADYLSKTHLRGVVTKSGKAHEAWNPFITKLLADRWSVYQYAVKEKMTLEEYYYAVTQWYSAHGFTDKYGNPHMGKAVGMYERDFIASNPDYEWGSPSYQSKKSHHGTSEINKKNEREAKEKWRQSEAGRKSIEASRARAKENKLRELH